MKYRIRNILKEAISFEDRSNINNAFWKWFGDSKVVDDNGNPLICYHGTSNDFSEFAGDIMYFSPDPQYAQAYTSRSNSAVPKTAGYYHEDIYPNIMPVYLSIQKPFDTRRNQRDRQIFNDEFYMQYGTGTPLDPERGYPDWTDAMDLIEFFEEKEYDYDGLILAESHGRITYAVFYPPQIKSIFNQGTWDANDKDIMK